jgi:glutamate-ammonia-ligase adenylyltransferase
MRDRMAAHKPPRGPFDAKLLPGGLVDLEFAVHVVQLVEHAGFSPDLGHAIDLLMAERLMPARMRRAHDFLTRLLVVLRLVAPDAAEPPAATRALIARAVGLADWTTVVAWLEATRQEVAAVWRERVGEHDG